MDQDNPSDGARRDRESMRVTCASVQPLRAEPSISVIVPVRNEEDFLGETLKQLSAQDYPASLVEILVCDGRSTDRTRQIVCAFADENPRIRLIDNPGGRSSSGRNVGFRAATGDILLVIDGHVFIPSTRLFRNLVEALRETDADCAGRPQPLRATPGNAWSEAIALARGSALGHGRDSLIYGGFEGIGPAASNGAAYRRHVLDVVGEVDEAFDACEDLDFNQRIDAAGLRCVHRPGLCVEYFARQDLGGLFRQMRRYGIGRFQYLRKDFGSRFSFAQLVPAALVLAALGAISAPWLGWLGGACVLAVSAYLALVLGTAMSFARKHPPAMLTRIALALPTLHLGLGLGFLEGMLRGGPAPVGALPALDTEPDPDRESERG